jgi:ferric-dicitrate binding protein FerR (iron transport regulator)
LTEDQPVADAEGSGDDPAAEQDTTARGWTRFASNVGTLRQTDESGGSRRLLLFAAAVAMAAATVLTLGFRSDSQLTLELRGAASHGGVIEARRGEATVALSDGSSILAENGTLFQVDLVGRNSALTRLLAGKLHVSVAHNEDTSYRFVAGPYEVRVVGTEFDLAWSAHSGLTVSMAKGEVRLLAPGGKVRILKAGDSLSLPPAVAFEHE